MAIHRSKIKDLLARFIPGETVEALRQRLAPNPSTTSPRLRHLSEITPELLAANWRTIKAHTPLTDEDQAILCPSFEAMVAYGQNIENPVGLVSLPIGVAGPLRINGLFANGDFYVPLATSEAALVASYARGAALITASGGATSLVLNDTMTRAPGFVFENIPQAIEFVMWLDDEFEALQALAATTSRFGRLKDMRVTMEGNHVYVNFDFYTGNASGQNMVTIAAEAIIAHIKAHSPITVKQVFIEANFSGDKKASSISFLSVRGKKITAEVTIPAAAVEKTLHTTVKTMTDYALLATNGGIMSGTMGIQGHFANGLTALYLATGQDAACVSESAVGVTRLEMTDKGDLYASVTMPNIVVGTVGGGTKLPTQSAALKMLGLKRIPKSAERFLDKDARAVQAKIDETSALGLAEVCAVTCLAGEISIMGAICAGEFSSAHARLARGK